jgi:hypothetical protein
MSTLWRACWPHPVIRELQMIAHHPERGPTEKQSSLWILPPFAPASQPPRGSFPHVLGRCLAQHTC